MIFRSGPSELGVHPASWEAEGGGTEQTSHSFDLSLMCEDLATTMTELAERGAEFAGEVEEQPWGRTVQLRVPGAGSMTLYQPTYPPPALDDPPATPPG